MNFKFSGHDTFQCKQQWLLKGYRFVKDRGHHSFSNTSLAIAELGVGKNMVQSLRYWIEAFYIFHKDEPTLFGEFVFGENGVDNYLEDEATLWLLQYNLCSKKYASIYNIIFSDFFQDKASLEFSETRVVNYILKYLHDLGFKSVSEKTIANDFKVFVKSYNLANKELKNIEDDYNSPLIELNLIEALDGENYKIKKELRTIPYQVLAYCIVDILEGRNDSVISYRGLQKSIGNYFCLSSDGLDKLIEDLTAHYPDFVYNEDAGIAQLQVKNIGKIEKFKFLEEYYGVK